MPALKVESLSQASIETKHIFFVQSLSPGMVNTEMVPTEHIKSLPDPELILKTADVSSAVMFALSCPPSVEVSLFLLKYI